jgi:putative glycosyltransferase
MGKPSKLSIVSTLYYSEKHVEEFCQRMLAQAAQITEHFEIILVNDGSPDQSKARVLALQRQHPNITLIDLSRNFGHHRAIYTGLKHANGDNIFLIDSDLEEEPELLSLFWLELQKDGELDVVYGVQGRRKGQWVEQLSGALWYNLFARVADIDYPVNSLTARLMTRRYVEAVLAYEEKELEIWGVFVLAGFQQKAITVTKGSKGSTTYSLRKKIRMAINSITSFSSRPLLYIFALGILIMFISFGFIVYLVCMRLLYQQVPEGWTSTLVSLWFIGGLLLFSVGIIGIYLSKMFLEIKNRPLAIIRKIYKGDGAQ